MSFNSSSLADILFPNILSNSTLKCLSSTWSTSIFSTFAIAYILLLLPLLLLVLHVGFQQWRRQRFTSTAAASHCDHFTHHSIVLQLNEVLGFILFLFSTHISLPQMRSVGLGIWTVSSVGQGLFHLLTCVDRYLAIVHPVAYLRQRQARGVRIRNLSIGCVWLLSLSWVLLHYTSSVEVNIAVYACSMVLALIVISFCSVVVLCVLKRPRLGEAAGIRGRVDQSKQRAFHAIMAIMGVLLFRFGGNMVTNVMHLSSVLDDECVVLMSIMWFNLPSRLVLPLLFLHRVGVYSRPR